MFTWIKRKLVAHWKTFVFPDNFLMLFCYFFADYLVHGAIRKLILVLD